MSSEGNVERREEDVKVLGIRDEDEKGTNHDDVGVEEHRLDGSIRRAAKRSERVGDPVGGERPRTVREVPGVRRRASVDEQRHDHQRDARQYQPCGTGVGPIKARSPPPSGR